MICKLFKLMGSKRAPAWWAVPTKTSVTRFAGDVVPDTEMPPTIHPTPEAFALTPTRTEGAMIFTSILLLSFRVGQVRGTWDRSPRGTVLHPVCPVSVLAAFANTILWDNVLIFLLIAEQLSTIITGKSLWISR